MDQVHRFVESWEADASLQLRAGEVEAIRAYQSHRRLSTVHPAVLADRVARHHEKLSAHRKTVAITTASASTARAINQAIQHRHGTWRAGRSVGLRDATQAYVDDCVTTRRNDKKLVTNTGRPVRNRHTWTVTRTDADGSLTVHDPQRGHLTLPTSFVAQHVELGWAVTGYGGQGDTVDVGIAVVEASTTRAGLYVGMTRGRSANLAVIVDESGTADPSDVVASIIQRPANGVTAHAMRDRLRGHVVGDPAERMRRRLHELEQRPAPARRLTRR